MNKYLWLVLIVSCIALTGCAEEEIYMCNSCGNPNVTDVNVYNCTSRTEGQAGYDYTTNDYYYCNSSTWVKLNNQTGGGTINITNNITNNYTINGSQVEQMVGNWSGNQSSYNTITADALSDFNMWGCYRNGTYCNGLMTQGVHTTATAYTANVLRCFPYITGKGYKIDQLGVIVATANVSNIVKVALYSDNGFGYPNALLTNTSNMSSASTGFLGQTIPTYQLQNNTLYWICSATNNGGTTMRVNVAPISSYPTILGLSSGTTGNIGYTVAYTYTNALPNPYTSGATYVTAIYPTAFTRVRTDI